MNALASWLISHISHAPEMTPSPATSMPAQPAALAAGQTGALDVGAGSPFFYLIHACINQKSNTDLQHGKRNKQSHLPLWNDRQRFSWMQAHRR
jgi:hypothetical protein